MNIKVRRIVRSRLFWPLFAISSMVGLVSLGYLIQGYIPMGPFGNPDPTVIIFPLLVDGFAAWFWFRSYCLFITDKVVTSRGPFRVHNREPIAIFDPLDYVKFNKVENLSDEAFKALVKWVEEKYGEGSIVFQKHLEEYLMGVLKDFRDAEYKNYISRHDYDSLAHGLFLQEYREDGGDRRVSGFRGSRNGGNAVLVNPVGMVRNYGSDAICYTYVENFWGLDLFGFELENAETKEVERFPGLPHYILLAVLEHNPYFRLGDHMVSYGTEPLHPCVRAKVEENKDLPDNHKLLESRPKYAWTLAAPIVGINGKARIAQLEHLITQRSAKWQKLKDGFDLAKAAQDKVEGKEEPPDVDKTEVEENGN